MSKKNLHPQAIVDKRGCQTHVMNVTDAVPPAFANLVSITAKGPNDEDVEFDRVVIRIAGGCKHISPEIVDAMPGYFLDAFRTVDEDGKTVSTFRGTAFSGGTANMDEDGVFGLGMVTNMPAVLAANYPCIAMSTTPRTAIMALNHDTGGLIVDDWGGRIDARQHGALIVQEDPAEVLDWDGDLETYLTLMEGWKQAGFKVAGLLLNGGGVTRDEIYGLLKRGIHVMVVEGSLREADAFIKAWRDDDWSETAADVDDEEAREEILADCKAILEDTDEDLVSIVPINDAPSLREVLVEYGYLS